MYYDAKDIYYTKNIDSAVKCGVCQRKCLPHTTVPYFRGSGSKAIHWDCLRQYMVNQLAGVDEHIAKRMIGGGRRSNRTYPVGL